MFRFSNVTKLYAGKRALGPIDLELGRGSTTVLIGRSGCGKSTAIRLLAGLTRADSGNVDSGGVRIDGSTTEATLRSVRRRIGYVIQEGGLFPHLTSLENLRLAPRSFGESVDQINRRVHELTELVGLSHPLLERYPAQLSGGQRQRVALMRALMLDPEMLLLDEPLGALDPMIRAELQDELRVLFKTLRTTVVLVTHDLAEAAYLGNRIVLLDQGRVVQDGGVSDLFERPATDFVRSFVAAQRGFDCSRQRSGENQHTDGAETGNQR